METNKHTEDEKVPEVVKDEPNDKPAGRGIMWTIIIAVIILAVVYHFFFRNNIHGLGQ